MFKQTKFKVFLFLAVLLGGLPVNMLAQQKASHLEKKVNLPPNTVEGTLANGLHYLILPNEAPIHIPVSDAYRFCSRVGRAKRSRPFSGAYVVCR